MKHPDDRYFLIEETDGSLSICDRRVDGRQRDHRIVTGLRSAQAAELLEKLNSTLGEKANEQPV